MAMHTTWWIFKATAPAIHSAARSCLTAALFFLGCFAAGLSILFLPWLRVGITTLPRPYTSLAWNQTMNLTMRHTLTLGVQATCFIFSGAYDCNTQFILRYRPWTSESHGTLLKISARWILMIGPALFLLISIFKNTVFTNIITKANHGTWWCDTFFLIICLWQLNRLCHVTTPKDDYKTVKQTQKRAGQQLQPVLPSWAKVISDICDNP